MTLSDRLLALGKTKRGEIKIMPPPGASGASGYSGYSGYSGKAGSGSGISGASGYSGYSGPQGPQGIQGIPGTPGSSLPSTGDIVITGSLTTGSAGGKTGDVALSGATSGAVHLRAEANAGTGIFLLPNTTGTHTVATLDDIAKLRAELGLP
jgi:hypothetical protein